MASTSQHQEKLIGLRKVVQGISPIEKAASTIQHSKAHFEDTFSMTTKSPLNAPAIQTTAQQLTTLDMTAKQLLEKIGRDLDREVFPVVWNTGLVLPSRHDGPIKSMGKELIYERQIKNEDGSTAGTWQGSGGAPGTTAPASSTSGSRAAGQAAPLACGDVSPELRNQLNDLVNAYPGTRIWPQGKGLWIFVQSALLPSLGRTAGFVIQVAPQSLLKVRSWGFWLAGTIGASWIGPRHTNYGDGSICAFDKDDRTWTFGDSLVGLVDLYSVWAVRHLHLETFGYWPGPQASRYPYERLMEFHDDEHCGCANSGTKYSHCCKPRDREKNLMAMACSYVSHSCWTIRQAPKAILDFVMYRTLPVHMNMPGESTP